MPICELTTKDNQPNWCEEHQRFHNGHYRDYALDPGAKGEEFRALWARMRDGTHTPPIVEVYSSSNLLRSGIKAEQCRFLGRDRISNEDAKNLTSTASKLNTASRGCGGRTAMRRCSHPSASIDGYTTLARCCNCLDWQDSHLIKPSRVIRFDETNLAKNVPGKRFNPSIIEHEDAYAFIFRNGWRGSNLYMIRMDRDFQPKGEAKMLELRHKDSNYGREDPRLFRLNGRLHVVYTGVVGGTRIRHTNVLFARLREDTFAVEDVFHPEIKGRNFWEKNHAYFDYQGIAHAVYSIAPHKILRVEGNKTEWAYETPTPFQWSGGRLCGGAAPVLHKGEWYHFFHGSNEHGRRVYNIGCCVFSAEPPFSIVRMTPNPFDIADHETCPPDQYCDCIFPGGAVYRDGKWAIAMGVHDRWSEIRFYDAKSVESRMVTK